MKCYLNYSSFHTSCFASGHHAANSDRIDGDGFLAEDMLTGCDRSFHVHRAKARWGRQQHDIDVGLQKLIDRV